MDGDKQAQIQYDFLTDGRNCEGPDASEIPSLAAFLFIDNDHLMAHLFIQPFAFSNSLCL